MVTGQLLPPPDVATPRVYRPIIPGFKPSRLEPIQLSWRCPLPLHSGVLLDQHARTRLDLAQRLLADIFFPRPYLRALRLYQPCLEFIGHHHVLTLSGSGLISLHQDLFLSEFDNAHREWVYVQLHLPPSSRVNQASFKASL
jgi:hypothetical protein